VSRLAEFLLRRPLPRYLRYRYFFAAIVVCAPMLLLTTVPSALAADALWLRFLLTLVFLLAKLLARVRPHRRLNQTHRFPRQAARLAISSLTDLAALLAGGRRQALREEWHAHLAGESGHDPITWREVRQALGFIAAALQFRLADAADLAWRPADAVLGSRILSNLFVGGPVIVVLFAIVHHDGRFGLVTDIQDAGELGAFLYGVIRAGRWWRAVKPPEPKARRAKE